MDVNIEVVKSALTDFEKEDFVSAKDKLVNQIHIAKNNYFRDKVGIQKDVYQVEPEKVEKPADDIEAKNVPDPELEVETKPKRKNRLLKKA